MVLIRDTANETTELHLCFVTSLCQNVDIKLLAHKILQFKQTIHQTTFEGDFLTILHIT